MFKGLGDLAKLGPMMQQAQQMMQKMEGLQDLARTKKATGAAGGGLIEIDINGASEVLAVRIDPSLFEKGDREMFEDLLPAAFNLARQKALKLHDEAKRELTGDLNIPGLDEVMSKFTGSE